jgi:hypothetical protein
MEYDNNHFIIASRAYSLHCGTSTVQWPSWKDQRTNHVRDQATPRSTATLSSWSLGRRVAICAMESTDHTKQIDGAYPFLLSLWSRGNPTKWCPVWCPKSRGLWGGRCRNVQTTICGPAGRRTRPSSLEIRHLPAESPPLSQPPSSQTLV